MGTNVGTPARDRYRRLLLVLVLTVVSGAVVITADPAQAATHQCTITFGEGGVTHTRTAFLDDAVERDVARFDAVPASSFIRSTTGPCVFSVFNGTGFTGRNVALGTDLTGRIRAGVDGIANKDDGGGDTWRVRSIMIHLASPNCRVVMGGNGIRMTYLSWAAGRVLDPITALPATPGMDRITRIAFGASIACALQVYNSTSFTGNTAGFQAPIGAVNLGWRSRSMILFAQFP